MENQKTGIDLIIPLKDGELRVNYKGISLYKNNNFIRYLDKYESDFVNSVLSYCQKEYNELDCEFQNYYSKIYG